MSKINFNVRLCKHEQITESVNSKIKNEKKLWSKLTFNINCCFHFFHNQNKITEQTIQTVKKMTMFLLTQIRLSICFWAEAVITAIYFQNWLSIRIFLTEMISLVAVYSEYKFDQYNHFRLFDCLYYVMIFKDKQKNWQLKSRMCIFLSYIWNSITVYKVMNLTTHHIFMTIDIQ